jgi:hypothetical protein
VSAPEPRAAHEIAREYVGKLLAMQEAYLVYRQHPYLCPCLPCHVVRDRVLWLVRDRRQAARISAGDCSCRCCQGVVLPGDDNPPF